MKKTKLLTSLTAFLLVLTFGACSNSNDDIDESITTEEDDNSDSSQSSTTLYKLGAFDETEYTYRYFNGEASTTSTSHFLATSTSWDDGADISIDALDDGGVTLSFINDDGDTKYLAWSSSSAVDIDDSPYPWYWLDNLEVFAGGSTDGRVLVLYSNGSIRAYTQNDTNLANPHVYPYLEEPIYEREIEEINLTQASSLENGKQYYIGDYQSSTDYHLATGSLNGYNLGTSVLASQAALFTASGNDSDGWKLTLSDGTYPYIYSVGDVLDFGLSLEEEVPSSGVNTFLWSSEANTLYTTEIQRYSYTYTYFEFYQNNVAAYGTNDLSSVTNQAHFYTVTA